MARSPMARIASLVALLAFVGYANAARTPVGASRSLLQLDTCDIDCADTSTSCRTAGTEGKFICTACRALNSDNTPTYLVPAVDGSCGCAPGQYLVAAPNGNGLQKCEDCPLNFYCPGGTKTKSAKLPCHYKEGTADAATTEGLNTRRTKSRSRSSCVNKPGYSYSKSATGVPTAVKCTVNTYSTGLLKQATCTPCPAGSKVDPNNIGGKTNTNLRDSIEVCKAPPGWFISTGYKVVKCPKGEYKGGYNTDKKCTKCPEGLTTKTTGSSAFSQCDRTMAGYSFVAPSASGRHLLDAPEGLSAQLCPQKFYCEGGVQYSAGATGATPCPTGLWTRGLGAKSLDACLVPPGYYFSTAENTVKECSTAPFAGEYQPVWGKPTDTIMQSCSKCGDEFRSEATIPLDVYTNDDNSLNGMPNSTYVRGAETSCYIEQGMGVIPKGSGVAAVYCNGNSYGVASTANRYGRTPEACVPCSIDMQTDPSDDIVTQWNSWNQNYPRTQRTKADGTTVVTVFYGPEACIVPPGFGYDGDIAIACPKGTYAPGARAATSFDDIDNKCTACPDGRTTTNDRRTQLSDCNLILPGYGYATVNNVGMAVPCEAGFYRGPTTISFGTSSTAACQACPTSRTTSGPRSTQQSDCNLCVPGYGIADANPSSSTACTACGTPSDNTKAGTYGPADREAFSYACKDCPAGTEYVQSIFYQNQTKPFTPRLVTPNAAQTASQCMLEFAQIDTRNNFLVATSWMLDNWQQKFAKTDTSGAGANVAACVAKCQATDACQMVQYDHSASGSTIACYMRTATDNTNDASSDVLIAAKNQLSTQQTVTSSSLDGVYTFWEDSTGGHYQLQDVGVEQPSQTNTLAKCLEACTNEGKCAFAAMSFGTEANGKRPFSKCYLVNGVLAFSSPKQQLIRAVPTKLAPNAKYIPA